MQVAQGVARNDLHVGQQVLFRVSEASRVQPSPVLFSLRVLMLERSFGLVFTFSSKHNQRAKFLLDTGVRTRNQGERK